jgi:medium-chain acyl-[acyl-carrier-protein] hydrolase
LSSPWFVRPDPRPFARLRLFCFPHAGVGATAFRPWAAELPADVELIAVQPPGRETRLREPPFEVLDELLAELRRQIEPWLDREFAFFGHSMGACVAYEITRSLRDDRGPLPTHLFVSGRRAPGAPVVEPPLHPLTDDEFVAEIRRRYDGIPDEVMRHPELLALLLPCLRADIAALERHPHRPGPPLPAPILAFGGAQDPCVSATELGAWRAETAAGFSLRLFPGGHFYLQTARRALLESLTAALSATRTSAEPQPTGA